LNKTEKEHHVENEKDIDQRILSEVVRNIRQVNFGEVIITIHDAKIVQIERREKKRYTH
jgi:hypothetical protein